MARSIGGAGGSDQIQRELSTIAGGRAAERVITVAM